MDKYIGVKLVEAAPMSKYEFYEKRGLPVNDIDAPGYEVIYEDGYQSWSPKDVFEKAYKGMPFTKGHTLIEVNIATGVWDYKMQFSGGGVIPKVARMTFGEAIDAMRGGELVMRKGLKNFTWFVCRQVPASINKDIVPKMQSLPDKAKKALEEYSLNYVNQMIIVEHDGTVTSYTPTTEDIFADDWYIVEV